MKFMLTEDARNVLETRLKNLTNIEWPTPKWLRTKSAKANVKHRTDYRDYLATQLRALYSETEASFRTLSSFYLYSESKEDLQKISTVVRTSEQLIRFLESARLILEEGLSEEGSNSVDKGKTTYLGKQELLLANNFLNLAEEYLIWIYTPDIAEEQIPYLIECINETKNLRGKEEHIRQLEGLKGNLSGENGMDFRPIFDQVTWIYNYEKIEEIINTGLQIERLRYFAYWGTILLGIFLFIFPTIFNFGIFEHWQAAGYAAIYNTNILENHPIVNHAAITWIVAIGIAITGAIGAYLSGFLQTRSSGTNLALYEESLFLSRVRLEFGAFAALITLALLSWNLLEGLLSNSPGPFILTAFLSGFSERYFLDLLKLKPDNEQQVNNNQVI